MSTYCIEDIVQGQRLRCQGWLSFLLFFIQELNENCREFHIVFRMKFLIYSLELTDRLLVDSGRISGDIKRIEMNLVLSCQSGSLPTPPVCLDSSFYQTTSVIMGVKYS